MSAGDAGTGPPRELPGSVTKVHQYDLPLSSQGVWSLISEASHYRRWWPWLRAFDAGALAEREEWRCEAQPPDPCPLGFRVVIEHTEAPVLVRSLAPGTTPLPLVSRFAGPIARTAHDWVLDSGARQFVSRGVQPLVGD